MKNRASVYNKVSSRLFLISSLSPDGSSNTDNNSGDDASNAGPVEPSRGGMITFNVTIEAHVQPFDLKHKLHGSRLHNPSFRFQFINDEKVRTEPMPLQSEEVDAQSDEGWTIIQPEQENEDEDGEDTSTKEKDSEVDSSIVDPTIKYKWSREFEPIESTEEFAKQLQTAPYTTFFLSDEKCSTHRDRPYIGHAQLDLSVFLAGETQCTYICSAEDYVGVQPKTDPNHCETLAPELKYLRLTVSTNRPLLSEELESKLNPLSVTIRKIKGLPGTNIDMKNNKERQFAKNGMHDLLNQYCRPMYAVFRFYDGDAVPRVCRTRPLSQARAGNRMTLNHTTVFLAGLMSRNKVQEWLDSRPLLVELHDRDILLSNEDRELQEEKWEAMLRGHGGVDEGGAGEENPDAVPPMDIFDVDQKVLAQEEAAAIKAASIYAHGQASFRLNGLLNRANELTNAFKRTAIREAAEAATAAGIKVEEAEPDESLNDKSVCLKLQSDVLPKKRQQVPSAAEKIAEWDLSDEERICRRAPLYVQNETQMAVTVRLSSPIFPDLTPLDAVPQAIFERAIFMFPYKEVEVLQQLREAMDAVNAKAIPFVSLRSYQLTPEQATMADEGKLDIVSGFQAVDDNTRIIVVEGLSEGGMQRIREGVPRTKSNTDRRKFFCSPEVRFTTRIYTPYHVDLKMVRLRDPLQQILKNPNIYNRALVSQKCFDALHRLGELRKTNRMRTVKIMNLFPEVEGLEELESKYGETVTLMDMFGRNRARRKLQVDSVANALKKVEAGKQTSLEGGMSLFAATKLVTKARRVRRKAATEATNKEFEEMMKTRASMPAKDYLSGHMDEAKKMRMITREKKRLEWEAAKNNPNPVYIYGNQKMSSKAAAQARLRKRIAQDKNAVFTYSKDYVSQTVTTVDPNEVFKEEARQHKAKYVTSTGFVYPPPKDPKDYNKHPRAPSQFRVDELAEEWLDPTRPVSPSQQRGSMFDPNMLTPGGFSSIPTKSMTFGMLKKIDKTVKGLDKWKPVVNPTGFQSVHLTTEEDLLLDKTRRQKDWDSKVVVDDTRMAHHYPLKKGNQVDRLNGILDGGVKLKGYTPDMIPALLPKEPYVERNVRKGSFRPDEPDRMITKEGFVTTLHKDRMKSKSQKSTSSRRISKMAASEKTGPKWYSKNV